MFDFDAGRLATGIDTLSRFAQYCFETKDSNPLFFVGESKIQESLSPIKEALLGLREFSESAEMPSVKKSAERFLVLIAGPKPMGTLDANHAARELIRRIRDDLETRFALGLSDREQRSYELGELQFGQSVLDAFGQASFDIDEAAKCFGVGRYTASAFHVMRVMEFATQTVATRLGVAVVDKNGKNRPWGQIANDMRPKIDSMQGDPLQAQWYRAQSFLVVFNRAWRVPTAHPGAKYTQDEMQGIADAAKSFLTELAALA